MCFRRFVGVAVVRSLLAPDAPMRAVSSWVMAPALARLESGR
jgi:hypothetical protein